MIKKELISWIRRIKTTSLSNFPKNNVNLPELKNCGGIAPRQLGEDEQIVSITPPLLGFSS